MVSKKNGEWSREYGNWEHPGSARDIKETTDGYVLAGTTSAAGSRDVDAQLIKIDRAGNKVWNTTFGGDGYDWINSVGITEGGYILGGYTKSFESIMGFSRFWLVKIDKEGKEIWNRTYGESYDGLCTKAIPTNDGGYALVGYAKTSPSSESDLWIIKTDINGDIEWKKMFGGEETDWGEDIIELKNGYLVSGETRSYSSHGHMDAWLIKIDKQGREIWNKTYGWSNDETFACIETTEDGYVVGGYCVAAPKGTAFLIKVDMNGNEVWARSYGRDAGKTLEAVWDIEKTIDGYILGGATETFDIGLFDGWLIKVDRQGNAIWDKNFGGRTRDVIQSVLSCKNGYLLAGQKGYHNESREWGVPWVIKCSDLPPPLIEIVRPRRNYLYLFDREIMPFSRTVAIGGITFVVDIQNNPAEIPITKVELYARFLGRKYEYQPRVIISNPPYQWKWEETIISPLRPVEITAAAYYGKAGGAAVDKTELYIINLISRDSTSESGN
jgi:hypothetical protein